MKKLTLFLITIKAIAIELLILAAAVAVFAPLFIVGFIYSFFKHIIKRNYSANKQLLPIIRSISLLLDGLANAGAGELLNDLIKPGGSIRYGKWYQTISAVTGLIYLFEKDTRFRKFLDKILGKNHCTEAINEMELKYFKGSSNE